MAAFVPIANYEQFRYAIACWQKGGEDEDAITRRHGPISCWNVSAVIDGLRKRIENWDVSKIYACAVVLFFNEYQKSLWFSQYGGGWNVPEVTDVSFLSSHVTSCNYVVGNWDVSNV